MSRPSREQWDALAAFWERFEVDGLRPDHLARLDVELGSPCVVVGSGLGLLCEGLMAAGVDEVVGVDFSPVMVERSRELRSVHAVVGRADALPFDDSHLGSAVVATGVFDPTDDSSLASIWAELARVVRSGGIVLAAFFDPAQGFREFLDGTGILEDASQRMDRAMQLWRHWGCADEAAGLVASWTRTSPEQARRSLERVTSFLDAWFAVLDQTVEQLTEQGQADPKDFLVQCFDWVLPGMVDVETALAGAHDTFQLIDVKSFEQDSVTVFAFCRL